MISVNLSNVFSADTAATDDCGGWRRRQHVIGGWGSGGSGFALHRSEAWRDRPHQGCSPGIRSAGDPGECRPARIDRHNRADFIAGDEGMAKIIAASNIHGRLIEPGEIADAVVWLASEQARMVNGQSLIVDGGGIVR